MNLLTLYVQATDSGFYLKAVKEVRTSEFSKTSREVSREYDTEDLESMIAFINYFLRSGGEDEQVGGTDDPVE